MKNLKFLLLIFLVSSVYGSVQAQDWANLSRYHKDNANLGVPAPGENRVVFMGNSITEGWSRLSPGFFAGKPYVNRGISGQTTPQMLVRFRQDVIELEPSVVVILAGINDIAGNTGPATIESISGNIFSMVELARAHNIGVILCSVLPASRFPWRPELEPAEKVVELNAELQAYAWENGVIYVDYYSEMVNETKGLKAELGSDGVHPNEAGYSIMEPLVEEAIASVLKK